MCSISGLLPSTKKQKENENNSNRTLHIYPSGHISLPLAVSASGSDGARSSVLKHCITPSTAQSNQVSFTAPVSGPEQLCGTLGCVLLCCFLWLPGTRGLGVPMWGPSRHWVHSALRADLLVSSFSKLTFPERGSLSGEAREQEEKILL